MYKRGMSSRKSGNLLYYRPFQEKNESDEIIRLTLLSVCADVQLSEMHLPKPNVSVFCLFSSVIRTVFESLVSPLGMPQVLRAATSRILCVCSLRFVPKSTSSFQKRRHHKKTIQARTCFDIFVNRGALYGIPRGS